MMMTTMENISVQVVMDCIYRKMDAASMFEELVLEYKLVSGMVSDGMHARFGWQHNLGLLDHFKIYDDITFRFLGNHYFRIF